MKKAEVVGRVAIRNCYLRQAGVVHIEENCIKYSQNKSATNLRMLSFTKMLKKIGHGKYVRVTIQEIEKPMSNSERAWRKMRKKREKEKQKEEDAKWQIWK